MDRVRYLFTGENRVVTSIKQERDWGHLAGAYFLTLMILLVVGYFGAILVMVFLDTPGKFKLIWLAAAILLSPFGYFWFRDWRATRGEADPR